VRPLDQHLTASEVAGLLKAGALSPDSTFHDDPGDARSHLEICKECSALYDQARWGDELLQSLKTVSNSGQKTDACPPPELWAAYYACELSREQAEEIIAHASECTYCAGLVAAWNEDDPGEDPARDQDLIQQLKSSGPEWQREMAQAMASSSTVGTIPASPFRHWRLLSAIAAGFVLAASVGWYRWRENSVSAATSLIAAAYSTTRTTEFRFPGARHSTLAVERNASDSLPPTIYDAAVKIQRGLASHPGSVEWLDAQARASLYKGQFADPIKNLSAALEAHPENAGMLRTDLALAYFERAESEGRPIDYGTSIDLLSQVLRDTPGDVEAHFNLALVYGRLQMWREALDAWDQYLKLDASGDWPTEARKNRATAEEHLHRRSALEPAASSDEESLRTATSEWLPALSADSDAASKARDLAIRLEQGHRDHWLASMLESKGQPNFAAASKDLAEAIRANGINDVQAAELHALRARDSFARDRSEAGELRAALEQTYSMQRSSRGQECLALLKHESSRLVGRQYSWLEVQFAQEESACAGMSGNPEQDLAAATHAVELAQNAGYHELYLRSLGFRASAYTKVGQFQEAWELDRTGLADCWNKGCQPARAQQFYYDMLLGAEAAQRWQLASALARESIRECTRMPNRSFEAIGRARLGALEARGGNPQEAARQLAQAEALFAALPQSNAVRLYRLYTAVGLAETGPPRDALRMLESFEDTAGEVDNQVIAARYLRVRAELLAKTGREAEAERSLDDLLAVYQRGLDSLLSAGDRISWQEETAAGYRDLTRLELARGDIPAAYRSWHQYLSSPCAHPAQETPIPPGTAILTYADLTDRVVLFVAAPEGVSAKFLASPRLRTLIRNFADLCGDPARGLDGIRAAGADLFAAVLGPAEERLRGVSTLIVEADGDIARIPFTALPATQRGAPGAYLGDRYRILSRPIARCDGASQQVATSGGVLVVSAPTIAEKWRSLFRPLPDARTEAEDIQRAFPSRTTILEGQDATLSAVESHLPGAAILHFAGHSFQRAAGVSLMLAGGASDGIWKAAHIDPRLLVSCRLAVFSACSTASPDRAKDGGSDDLVRAFLSAGVPQVVASRWNVNSKVTAAFMRVFYSRMARGETAADSLNASAQAIRGDSITEHPYYWAAFQLYGNL
jgi:CHAT domain-containing protein